MFLKLKDRLGVPGVIAVIALVFAMAGGAWAASGALTSKQKKEVKNIAKQYAGKPGAPGQQGPPGPAGANGKDGSNGTNGKDGTNGKSVVLVNEEPEGCIGEEGVTYEVQGTGKLNEVCAGPEGSPWTAGGSLPSESTETGAWTFGPTAPENGLENVAITFAIPLSTELKGGAGCFRESAAFKGECQVHYINPAGKEESTTFPGFEPEEFTSASCLGSAASPTAKPGHLCIYAAEMKSASVLLGDVRIFNIGRPESEKESSAGAGRAGALFEAKVSTGSSGWGTFAVTAP